MKTTLLFLLVALPASARVEFDCMSIQNMPAMAFEYATNNCGAETIAESRTTPGRVVELPPPTVPDTPATGEIRRIMCTYQAACKPVYDSPEPIPLDVRNNPVLLDEWNRGKFKMSQLVCHGWGKVDDKGFVFDVECPLPHECRRDVFYNFAQALTSHAIPYGTRAPDPRPVIKPEGQIE